MRSVSGPDPEYPMAMLTRRARRTWRRAERQIVRDMRAPSPVVSAS